MARLLVWMIVFSLPVLCKAQDIYLGTQFKLYKMDLSSCEIMELPYEPSRNQRFDLIHDLAFHPNGKLYASTYYDIIELDPLTGKTRHLIQSKGYPDFLATMAISEEGSFFVSDGGYRLLEYDLQSNRFINDFELSIPGMSFIWGFYKNQNLITHGISPDFSRRFYWSVNIDNSSVDTLMEFNRDVGFSITSVTKYYEDCGPPLYIGQAASWIEDDEDFERHFGIVDFDVGTVEKACIEKGDFNVVGIGNVDDFRHNGYLVDLDGDNSSGHLTGGNYDTLTLCNPTGRIADDDISYRLCEEEIDYISFRIKYADDPALPFEEITASESLERTGPHRWVWENPYGDDTEKISEFLRSVKYRADWPENEDYERTIVTTAHIGEDSTSSWSVLQLSGEVSRAGRDTTVSCCSTKEFINLRQYLSPMANKTDGYFEPELSSAGLFEPGEDPAGEYLYIVDQDGCPDTAVITMETGGEGVLDLRRYTICPGEVSGPVKLPGKNYDSILWWNGEKGHSTVIRPEDHGVLWVEVEKDGCTYRDTLSVYSVLGGGVAFDEKFADTVFICNNEVTEIEVRSMDSIYLEGQVYYSGEYIPFPSTGIYELTGHKFDCVVSKEITVLPLEEQIDEYSRNYPWCEGSSLELQLPENKGVEITWSDGFPDSVREVDDYGEYPFRIRKGNCEVEAMFLVVPDDDCGGGCRVAIPNAVSPNGDGINDDLELIIKECGNFLSVTLFDKWGGELYRAQEPLVPQEVWDRLPVGVYLVRTSYRDKEGNVKVEGGSVMVLR